jgi:hypothetical protein
VALIYEATSPNVAEVNARIVHNRATADLLVYVTETREAARGDALWHFVDSQASATVKVRFVTSRRLADLLVCFVDSRRVAKWNRPHPLQGQFTTGIIRKPNYSKIRRRYGKTDQPLPAEGDRE